MIPEIVSKREKKVCQQFFLHRNVFNVNKFHSFCRNIENLLLRPWNMCVQASLKWKIQRKSRAKKDEIYLKRRQQYNRSQAINCLHTQVCTRKDTLEKKKERAKMLDGTNGIEEWTWGEMEREKEKKRLHRFYYFSIETWASWCVRVEHAHDWIKCKPRNILTPNNNSNNNI